MRKTHERLARLSLGQGALGLVLAALSSCSYLLDDPYPAYTQRILALSDLDATIRQVSGGSGLLYINQLDYLESGSSSGVFLQVATLDGKARLLTLDGGDLGRPVAYVYTVDPVGMGTGLAATGQFVSGALAMNPATRTSAATGVYSPGILLSEAGQNYYFTASGTSMNTARYDSSWAFLGTTSMPISASGNWQLLKAGMGGGYYSFLFFDSSTNSFRGFRTPSIAAMAWSSIFDDPAVPVDDKTPQFTADMFSIGMTADGPVVHGYSRDGNGEKLSLVGFGPSLSYKDYLPRNSGSTQYFFEPSGRYWFLHESATGRFYKLRTWWK